MENSEVIKKKDSITSIMYKNFCEPNMSNFNCFGNTAQTKV